MMCGFLRGGCWKVVGVVVLTEDTEVDGIILDLTHTGLEKAASLSTLSRKSFEK